MNKNGIVVKPNGGRLYGFSNINYAGEKFPIVILTIVLTIILGVVVMINDPDPNSMELTMIAMVLTVVIAWFFLRPSEKSDYYFILKPYAIEQVGMGSGSIMVSQVKKVVIDGDCLLVIDHDGKIRMSIPMENNNKKAMLEYFDREEWTNNQDDDDISKWL